MKDYKLKMRNLHASQTLGNHYYCKSYIFWRISNMTSAVRFIWSRGNVMGNYSMWRYHFFFLILFLFSFPKDNNEDLARNSNGRTEGTDPGSCIGTWSGRTSGDQGYSQLFFYWPVATERGQAEGSTDKYLMISIWSCWSKMGGGEEGKFSEHLDGPWGHLQRPHTDHG